MTETDILVRLLVALLCGAAIGLERELSNHPAGFRTFAFVGLASALAMILQYYLGGYFDPTAHGITAFGGYPMGGGDVAGNAGFDNFGAFADFPPAMQGPHTPIDSKVDIGRIPAQLLTGIGFIGAGLIIKGHDSIIGLTSAACMFLTGIIGLVIGAGMISTGVITTIATIVILVCSRFLKIHHKAKAKEPASESAESESEKMKA